MIKNNHFHVELFFGVLLLTGAVVVLDLACGTESRVFLCIEAILSISLDFRFAANCG